MAVVDRARGDGDAAMRPRTILGFAVGPVTTAILSAASVPAMAWVFSPDDVGRLNVLQVVISFGILIFGLGLDQAYVREYHEVPDRPSLLKSTMVPGLLAWVVVASAGSFRAKEIGAALFGLNGREYYAIVVACVVIAYLSNFVSLLLRMQERGFTFSAGQVVPKLLLVLLVGAVAATHVERDFVHLGLTVLLSSAFGLLFVAWSSRADLRSARGARLDLAGIRRWLRFSLPLMLAGVAYWGLTATSSFALRSHSTFAELGIYSVTRSVGGVASVVQVTFSMIWSPLVYKWHANRVDMARVGNVSRQALAVVVGIFVASGVFAWVTDYVLPGPYAAVKYLVVAAIAQPLLYMLSDITGVGIALTRRTMLSLWSTLIALVVNLVLNLVLVGSLGARGAVVANTIGYFVIFVGRTEAAAMVWRRFASVKMYLSVTLAVVAAIANALLGPTTGRGFAWLWLALAPLAWWQFRSEWASIARLGGDAARRRVLGQ